MIQTKENDVFINMTGEAFVINFEQIANKLLTAYLSTMNNPFSYFVCREKKNLILKCCHFYLLQHNRCVLCHKTMDNKQSSKLTSAINVTLVLLGSHRVGKSSIGLRFAKGTFTEDEVVCTIGSNNLNSFQTIG